MDYIKFAYIFFYIGFFSRLLRLLPRMYFTLPLRVLCRFSHCRAFCRNFFMGLCCSIFLLLLLMVHGSCSVRWCSCSMECINFHFSPCYACVRCEYNFYFIHFSDFQMEIYKHKNEQHCTKHRRSFNSPPVLPDIYSFESIKNILSSARILRQGFVYLASLRIVWSID